METDIRPFRISDVPSADFLPQEDEALSPAEGARRHNLPLARTSFVGREREKLEVKRMLAMTRLLTLTGTGGCGKTRLALEVARDLVGAYPDGVWLVNLAPLSEPELVAQAVAQALGVREQPNRPLLETLKDALRSRKTLLVMDNCEHLVEAELGLRLAGALGGFWHTLSGYREGQRWLEAALANGETALTSVRVKALHWASWIAWERGDCERSMAFSEEGLALSREFGDTADIAAALYDLGAAAAFQNELERASALTGEAMTLQRELGDEVGLARSLLVLGLVALARYDYEQVMMLQEESLALAHKVEDNFAIILSLQHLAIASLYQGDYQRAKALYKRGLELSRQQKMKHLTIAHLHVSAALAGSQGQPQRSARLWAAAAALREAIGATLPPFKRRGWDPYIDTARAQLDEEAWQAAWAEGRAMPPEHAIEYALSDEEDPELPTLVAVPEQHSPPADEPTERLTHREQEIALCVARGLTNRQIAQELSISYRTVENHIGKILKKQGFSTRARIAAWVAQR